MTSMATDIYTKKILVFGCGNILFGNDGFGPEVIHHIQANYAIPNHVLLMDAGTGIRDFVFDLLLMEDKPEKVIIIDAVTFDNMNSGEVFEIDLPDVPKEKLSDFSLHQSPSSNLLTQLKQQGVDVKILGMHTDAIPNTIAPGLTRSAKDAVHEASTWIITEIQNHSNMEQYSTNA